ncbi:hypothetical protein L0657_10120 [Dyadobacter sp. CY345]|uniref:hypothetical protein n=1 Tax=Dyadobacter sp. CY345 TaxID=2909335 RepID=UPI001F3027BB|nr:hypothetical protein [Dyadobacter sp. CY345]MCF2444312.1 hypothetical protein [Dyadobacter sp. CY345]
MNVLSLKTRIFTISLIILTALNSTFGQVRHNDLIIKKDSTKIEGKILVVEERIVQYKKASDPNGPTFHILKSDIAIINYGNGETQTFPSQPNVLLDNNTGTVIYYPTNPWIQRDFVDNLSIWRPQDLKGAYRFYQDRSKSSKAAAIIFGVLGGAASITGIALVISGSRKDPYGYRYNSINRDIGIPLIVSGAITGLVVGIAGTATSKKYSRNMILIEEELIKRKEPISNVKICPGYNPFNRSGSLSISLNF